MNKLILLAGLISITGFGQIQLTSVYFPAAGEEQS